MILARVLGAVVLMLGLTVFAQAAPTQLTPDQARHLLARTGFAPTQSEVNAVRGMDARLVVERIVEQARLASPRNPAPEFVNQPAPVPFRMLESETQRQEQRRVQMLEGMDIKRWWMTEMLDSPTPLQERMVLFWHNHFATSQQKVVRSQAMWRQHQLLRKNALGNFRQLLHGIAKDPAMLVYLDGVNSRRGAPNENFAREVMELFTLGEARQGSAYSEQDIREAARAFTGWSVDRDDFSFVFRRAAHDIGRKTLFGHSGFFDGDDALDLMLEQPAAARFIVSKLWREFVSPQPQAAQVEVLAQRFARSGFDIALLVREMLLSEAFWDPANRGSLVKAPVELVVGTVRQFGILRPDPTALVAQAAALGQNLLVPPNVRGWPGYTDWIDASSLLGRKRFTSLMFQPAPDAGQQAMSRIDLTMVRGAPMREAMRQDSNLRFDAQAWLAHYGADVDREPSAASRAAMEAALLAVPATQPFAAGTVALSHLRSLTQDAAYQLK